jgi:hypothetical protein
MSSLSFDDLIPKEKRKAAPIAFDDLIPAAPPLGNIPAPPAAAATSAPVGGEATGTVQRPRWMDHADELMAATAAPAPTAQPEQPGFFSQLGSSLGVGIDQVTAGLSSINATAQDAAIKRTQDRLNQLIAQGQGDSREAVGLQRTLEVYNRRQGSNLASLAQRQEGLAKAPVYEGVKQLSQAESFGDAWNVLKQDPLNIIANLGVQSLPTMAPGLVAGFFNPVLGATVMGASSAGVELGSSLMEFARSNGVNTGNPDELRAFFANPGMLDEAKRFAATRAGIIGTVDALSAGVASKTLVPKAITNPVARGVTNVGVQIPVQGVAGAGGEAGAQVATEGRITSPGEVVAEGAGGLFTAPVEVASMRGGVRREQALKDQRQAAAGGVDESIVDPAELLADAIEFNARRTTTNPEAVRQAAVNALSPDNAQLVAQTPLDFTDLLPSTTAAQQPLPMPDNMATTPGGSFSEPGQVVQAGPGFTLPNVLAGIGEIPEPTQPTNEGAPDELRQEGQETAQEVTPRPEAVAIFNGLIDVMSGGYAGLNPAMQDWLSANGLIEVQGDDTVLAPRGQELINQLNPRGIGAQSPTMQQAEAIIDQFVASLPKRTIEPTQPLQPLQPVDVARGPVTPADPPAEPAPAPAPAAERVQGILQRMREGNLRSPSMATPSFNATPEEKASVEEMNVAASQAYEQAARQLLEGDLSGVRASRSNSLDTGLLTTLQDVKPQPIAKSAPLAKGFEGTLKAIGPIMPKADIRYYLNAIHLNAERGRIEATDGHRLIVINEDLTGRIPARPQGVGGDVLVGMDGRWATSESQSNGGAKGNPKPIDGKFPDVDRVLNVAEKGRTRTVSFDAAEFAAQARGIAAAAKLFDSKIVPARVSIDGAQSAFQPQYLADLADAFRRLGYDRFNLSLSEDGNGVLLAKSPDGKVTQLIMPMRDPGTPFAPIVGNDEKVFGEPKKPAAKKASPKKKAVSDFLAEQGVTDPEVVDAVAAEYDRLTGDEDVQDTDASDGAVAQERGQGQADADAEQSGQQAAQPELFQQDADAGRPAQDTPPQGGDNATETRDVNDRATVPAQRDSGATPSDRQGVSRDNGRQENQRIKGAGADVFQEVSFTNRQSIYKDAWIDLGYDPDAMALMPPERQFMVLAEGLSKTFGLATVQRSERSNIRLSIDQLLDAYRNMQFMAAALDLPTKALGLNGTLALGLTSQGKYLGAYYPQGTGNGRSADGLASPTATVVLPGRSNSFAHEWGHALDFYIVGTFQGAVDNLSGMVRNGESLSSQMPETVKDSFRLLMNAMFFDNAEMSARIMDLERRIEAAAQKGIDATKLKSELDRLRSGASQSRQGRSEFARSSGEYALSTGSDPSYWLKPTEMLARSFEAYVAHKVEALGGSTEFIAKGDDAYTSDADARLAKTFPKDSDRYNIFRAYDLLLDAIREHGMLNPDGEAAATVPADQRITNPLVYYQAQIDSSTSERVAAAWQAERMAFEKRSREIERLQSRPKDPRTFAQRVTDASAPVLHTNRGVLLTLVERYQRNGNIRAAKAIEAIAKKIATDPGSGRQTVRGGTYAEAVNLETMQRLNRLANIVKSNGIDNFTDEQLAQLTDVLTSVEFEALRVSPEIRAAANQLRNLMDSTYYYNRNSGMDIGYVADVGYLPRTLDEPVVMEAGVQFINDAAQVYEIVFDRDTVRASDDGADISQAINALLQRMKEADIKPSEHSALQGFVEAKKELAKLTRALNAANASGDADAIEAALAAYNEFVEENMDVFDDAYDYTKALWARKAAEDWQARILFGSPENFSAHSPQGSFLKQRVLPKEADKILARYYTANPIERISRYIEQSVRKAEYTRLFGNGQLTADMQSMIDAKVMPEDQQRIRMIVEQITGTDQSRIPDGFKRMVSNIHSIGNMTLLGRVVLTSLVEPMTVALQTGRTRDAFYAMAMTIREAFNTKKVREQRAIADLLGIVGGDMTQEIISNRLGGTVGESGAMQRMSSQFFRRVGLTGLTNAQRRVSMQLTGRYIMELAADIDADDTSAKQRQFATDELRDAGLTDADIQAFVSWTREFRGNLPGIYDLTDPRSGELTRMGKLYALMVGRLVNQAIQNPTAIDRPWAANTVVGRVGYGLLSFSMAFMRNVLIKNAKKVQRVYESQGAAGAAKVAALQVAAPLSALYMGHLLVTTAREALLNPDKWEEEEKKDNLVPWLTSLAFSRAGFTGLADPIYNAILGVKYQRDLANILAGSSGSYFLQAAQRIVSYFTTNSPNTNSAERSAVRGLYELLAQPAAAAAVGYVPGGPLLGYGMGLSYAYLSSPRAKENVQDIVAGEKDTKKSKTGQGSQKSSAF